MSAVKSPSDPFFNKSRPFTKRKREEASSRNGGTSSFRNGTGLRNGSARGNRGSSSRGASARGGSSRGTRGGSSRGATRGGRSSRIEGKGKKRAEKEDEELDEDADGGMNGSDRFDSASASEDDLEDSEEEDETETPAQKRLRLSQMYLKSLEKDTRDEEAGFDAADLDRDLIAERLQKDVLEYSGKMHLNVGSSLQLPLLPSQSVVTPRKGHRGPITTAVASEDGLWLYTCSKDGSIIKWDISEATTLPRSGNERKIRLAEYFPKRRKESSENETRKANGVKKGKEKMLEDQAGHKDEVLTLALSHDGKVLASGGKDKIVGVWNVEGDSGKWLRGLSGHKDQVAAVAFRLGTLQLYSTSFDRTIKLFDLSTLSYIETLFGHQDCIQHVNALRGELAISAGGRDKTVRYWKINEESQLVFRGGVASRVRNVLDGAMEDEGLEEEDVTQRNKRNRGEIKYVEGSIDCVAMVDDSTFLSGGDSGSICLWTITKKKPVYTMQLAHGVAEIESETEGKMLSARWITALACLPYGDLFASGSWDGSIRLWKIEERLRSFGPIASIPAVGFVNSLQIIAPSFRPSEMQTQNTSPKVEKSVVIVAGVSKEPRLGRWMRLGGAINGAIVTCIAITKSLAQGQAWVNDTKNGL